ncbi:MAG: hypothetical protein HY770_09180 [Chitinivibrionia bacterium]|nr:hypothetical protein [Chitinivibrionia bacterium]
MGLSAGEISEIDALLGAPDAGPSTLAALRARFPKLSLTRVDPSDIGVEAPFRQYKLFDLYLVDGSNHCLSLTDNPELATGLVVTANRGTP